MNKLNMKAVMLVAKQLVSGQAHPLTDDLPFPFETTGDVVHDCEKLLTQALQADDKDCVEGRGFEEEKGYMRQVIEDLESTHYPWPGAPLDAPAAWSALRVKAGLPPAAELREDRVEGRNEPAGLYARPAGSFDQGLLSMPPDDQTTVRRARIMRDAYHSVLRVAAMQPDLLGYDYMAELRQLRRCLEPMDDPIFHAMGVPTEGMVAHMRSLVPRHVPSLEPEIKGGNQVRGTQLTQLLIHSVVTYAGDGAIPTYGDANDIRSNVWEQGISFREWLDALIAKSLDDERVRREWKNAVARGDTELGLNEWCQH